MRFTLTTLTLRELEPLVELCGSLARAAILARLLGYEVDFDAEHQPTPSPEPA